MSVLQEPIKKSPFLYSLTKHNPILYTSNVFRSSNNSNKFLSTNWKTKKILPFFLNASFNYIMFGCLNIRNILTSLYILFLTASSSSVSLNFLIATVTNRFKYLTTFICFLVLAFQNYSVSTFSHHSNYFILIHILIYKITYLFFIIFNYF